MKTTQAPHNRSDVGWFHSLVWLLAAVGSFHLAQSSGVGWVLLITAFALIELSRQPTPRRAFYFLLVAGLGCYAPQLAFLWRIFGPSAISLWTVLAFWLGLFGLLLQQVRRRFGETTLLLLAPCLWMGLEYFRSELYPLRFSWQTLGMAFWATPTLAKGLGVYGLGFAVMAVAAAIQALRTRRFAPGSLLAGAAVLVVAFAKWPARQPQDPAGEPIAVAGVQLEFPGESQVLRELDQLAQRHPEAQLLMLSEFTFQGPVPASVRDWCRAHERYLVAGGKEPLDKSDFYNTAFVVGPDGEIVHRQAKSVPVQFMKDGLPATNRSVWNSPWGPVGIPTCYDLSYSRVVDAFIRQGARALLVPTMDVIDWGGQEHVLHARVAPLRAAEYGMPIFRVCSSGISQLVTANGEVVTSAGFPGEGETISGALQLAGDACLPIDRSLAPWAVAVTGGTIAMLLWTAIRRRRRPPPSVDSVNTATPYPLPS